MYEDLKGLFKSCSCVGCLIMIFALIGVAIVFALLSGIIVIG
jgi:hypothetical protein